MTRIIITNDGGAILIRQGTTVIVVAPEQAESVAANLLEHHRRGNGDPDTSGLPELELQTLATQYACDEIERLLSEIEKLKERRSVREFDSAVRGFYAVGGSRHSTRSIGCDGQDETETRSDGRQRMREAGLEGIDSTGG